MTAINVFPEARPPLPPFTRKTAIQKVRMAEDARNSREPRRVSPPIPRIAVAGRAEYPVGRAAIVELLTRTWRRELEYRLIKELSAFAENQIPCALSMNDGMMSGTGSAVTARKLGV